MKARYLWPLGVVVLPAFLALPLRAEELRSPDGDVKVRDCPDGWTERKVKLGAETAIAIEGSGAEPRPTITVKSYPYESFTEEKAFKLSENIVGKKGEVVDRPSGRFCRFEYETDAGRSRARVYAAFREKRLYYFIYIAKPERFQDGLPALEAIVDGAVFSPMPRKEAPLPAPPPVAPVASPSEVANPRARPTEAPKTAENPSTDPRKPAERDDFIVRDPERKGTDTAAVSSPAVAVHKGLRQSGAVNLVTPPALIAHDSEYDPEIWTAKHLVDGNAGTGWCSAPSAKAPHRFILELAKAVDVARITFDNACPEEKGFEGAAAREVLVESSTQGARGPWHELARGTLSRGKNDQPLDLPPNETRWIRISILSNHGHPTLTELMEIRAFAAEYVASAQAGTPSVGAGTPAAGPARTTDDGVFRIERLKLSRDRNGAAVDPPVFAPGDTFWAYFKPRAMRLNDRGDYGIEVDLVLEDSQGKEKLVKPKLLDHVGTPPRPPLSPFVSLKVELPGDFPTGSYTVRITARDSIAGKEVNERLAFEVKKAP